MTVQETEEFHSVLLLQMTAELAEEAGLKIDMEEFNELFKKHQDLSISPFIKSLLCP